MCEKMNLFYKVDNLKVSILCYMLTVPLFHDVVVWKKTDLGETLVETLVETLGETLVERMVVVIVDRIVSNRNIYDAIVGRFAYKNTTMLLPEMGEINSNEMLNDLDVRESALFERLLTTRLGVHVRRVPCVRANALMGVCLSLFPSERRGVLPDAVFGHLRERDAWQLRRHVPRDIDPQLIITAIRARILKIGEDVCRQTYATYGVVYFKVYMDATHLDLVGYHEPYLDFWNLFIKDKLEEQLGCKCDLVYSSHEKHKIIKLY